MFQSRSPKGKRYEIENTAKTNEALLHNVPTQADMNTPTQPVFNDIPSTPPTYDSDAIFREMDNEPPAAGTSTNAINLIVESASTTQQHFKTAGSAPSAASAENDKKHEPRIRASRRRFQTSSASSAQTNQPSTIHSSTLINNAASTSSTLKNNSNTLYQLRPLTPMNSFSENSGHKIFSKVPNNLPSSSISKNGPTKKAAS